MDTIKNEYLTEEYKALHPLQITTCIENVKFVCFVDETFSKAHPTPPLKQLDRLHFHSYYELFCVSEGSLKIKFENTESIIKEGETVIIAPSVLHRSFIESNNVKRYNLNFVMEKTNVKSDFDLFKILSSALVYPLYYSVDKNIETALKKMSECIKTNERIAFSLHFHEIINAIISKHSGQVVDIIRENSESRIYKIHHVINLHYMDDISVSDIAKMLFLSERQIRRIIKKYHSCTFSELICKMRMKAAYELLTTTDMKISEIAIRVGYNSLSGFYSAFKSEYGNLPLYVRKNK
ncbi:MAG: helix-turn-helix domain-containing protein [Clostridiales bacterium]|nr:helix-turn-helix domain-containing protein [Clostridiales bacterium]